jgi:hypothetical protein
MSDKNDPVIHYAQVSVWGPEFHKSFPVGLRNNSHLPSNAYTSIVGLLLYNPSTKLIEGKIVNKL